MHFDLVRRMCLETCKEVSVCVCANPSYTGRGMNLIEYAVGQAYHIQPGPTKLGCDRGSIKGRFDVYLHQ